MCHSPSPRSLSSSSEVFDPQPSVLGIRPDKARKHQGSKTVPSQLRALGKEDVVPMNQGNHLWELSGGSSYGSLVKGRPQFISSSACSKRALMFPTESSKTWLERGERASGITLFPFLSLVNNAQGILIALYGLKSSTWKQSSLFQHKQN